MKKIIVFCILGVGFAFGLGMFLAYILARLAHSIS